MVYKILFSPIALRQFNKLDRTIKEQICKKLDKLASNPRPQKCKQLTETDRLYRIRIGDYRVIYQINDNEVKVLVLKIGHRSEIYKNLQSIQIVESDKEL